MSILMYFQCIPKPSDDLPELNVPLSLKLPSLAIRTTKQANNYVSLVIERQATGESEP